MTYPAQNTDIEFKCLVEEVKQLRRYLLADGHFQEAGRSATRISTTFSDRRYKELFLHE